MAEIPRISGAQAVRAFAQADWRVVRIKGSHHVLKKDGMRYLLTIPCHASKTIGTGLLRKLIRDAGLEVAQFRALLDS